MKENHMKLSIETMQKQRTGFVPRRDRTIQGFALLFSALLGANAFGSTLLDPDPTPEPGSTRFGQAFTVISDVNADGVRDMVVGAPFQDGDFDHPGGSKPGPSFQQEFGPPQDVGKVWVISGADLSIIRVLDDPYYQMPQPDKFGGQFGTAIANTGDLNGDGVDDIIIGIPHRHLEDVVEGTAFNAGEAMVFSGADGSILYTLDAPDEPHENARFGNAVAGIGDVTGDGVPDLLVGEPKNDSDVTLLADTGTVYVFDGATGSLVYDLDAPELGGAEQNGRFGTSLANAGDLNHDGVSDFLVGSPGNSRVYAINGATGEVLYSVVSPQLEKLPSFGMAIAAGKDLNNDGIPDFIVGAPLQKQLTGIAYIFSGSNGSMLRKLTAAPQAFAKFGSAIALTNDLTGDGRPDIMISAPDHTVNGLLNAGEVYVFEGRTGRLSRTVDAAAPQAYAGFGFAVAGEDVTGDGIRDLLIGTPFQDADIFNPDTGDFETHIQIGQLEIQ